MDKGKVLQRWNRLYNAVLGNQKEHDEIIVMLSEEINDEQPAALEESKQEFGETKNNKSPWTDGLRREIFKYGGKIKKYCEGNRTSHMGG